MHRSFGAGPEHASLVSESSYALFLVDSECNTVILVSSDSKFFWGSLPWNLLYSKERDLIETSNLDFLSV